MLMFSLNGKAVTLWTVTGNKSPTLNVLNNIIPFGESHKIGNNLSHDRDILNLLDKYPQHLKFTSQEETLGIESLNAMGISKAMMEKIMVAKSRNSGDTTIVGTRYGNVMASRGSVIPLFHEQIINNEPITITDPNMTRFMMTLEDAVDLVLYAFEHANQGDLFVQKAPSATVGTLAQALIELYKSSSEIKVIGTRHGEKLYETLVNREDMIKAEDIGEYYRIPADNRDLNYAQYFSEGAPDISQIEDYHSHNTERLNVEGIKKLISTLAIVRKELFAEEVDEFMV